MQDLAIIISTTLMYSTPLIYTALGGVFSENSGIINIGLEGMMTVGAFAGATAGYFTGNPWIAFLIGGIAGMLFALIHAVATINFNADHTISGVAINLLAPGLSLFLAKILFDGATTTPTIPMENKMPRVFANIFPSGGILDTIFNNYATVYIAFILVAVVYYVLYKTKFGLRIRAVGEHPGAADTLGINVSRVRYSGVLISGFLAGLGGASMSLALVSSFATIGKSSHKSAIVLKLFSSTSLSDKTDRLFITPDSELSTELIISSTLTYSLKVTFLVSL